MRIIYLKKHIELDELPFIDATDVFKYASENTKEGLSLYQFALIIEKYFNYWNTNSPTAFGNPDYNHLEGEFIGYIKAKEFEKIETKTEVVLCKGNRKVWVIDKIEKPQHYYDCEKENIKTLNAILR